jgi:glycosyltransferase involved in cell wall biosynthesis
LISVPIFRQPLGGSESALCYLAEALAGNGHDIFVLNARQDADNSRGVNCLPLTTPFLEGLPALDAFVVLNAAGYGSALRAAVGSKTRLVLWTQHADDQPAVQPLRDPAEVRTYDASALDSDWQRNEFIAAFDLDPRRTVVLRNAISPAFERLFNDDEPILSRKTMPPVLAYTSTPYRGLDLLLGAFPRIRKQVPGVALKVFSSMQVYGIGSPKDEERYGILYRRCRETDGVEYVGSIPQPELAERLRSTAVLAYPNTFPETSCIAVLEAMAAGCHVVTSARAALPETTAGFATLVPVEGSRETYLDCFITQTVAALRDLAAPSADAREAQLRALVGHVNNRSTWRALAQQWLDWLRA